MGYALWFCPGKWLCECCYVPCCMFMFPLVWHLLERRELATFVLNGPSPYKIVMMWSSEQLPPWCKFDYGQCACQYISTGRIYLGPTMVVRVLERYSSECFLSCYGSGILQFVSSSRLVSCFEISYKTNRCSWPFQKLHPAAASHIMLWYSYSRHPGRKAGTKTHYRRRNPFNWHAPDSRVQAYCFPEICVKCAVGDMLEVICTQKAWTLLAPILISCLLAQEHLQTPVSIWLSISLAIHCILVSCRREIMPVGSLRASFQPENPWCRSTGMLSQKLTAYVIPRLPMDLICISLCCLPPLQTYNSPALPEAAIT